MQTVVFKGRVGQRAGRRTCKSVGANLIIISLVPTVIIAIESAQAQSPRPRFESKRSMCTYRISIFVHSSSWSSFRYRKALYSSYNEGEPPKKLSSQVNVEVIKVVSIQLARGLPIVQALVSYKRTSKEGQRDRSRAQSK